MTQSPLEAALPLTPLQEGMLFHALYDNEGIDVYVIQVSLDLRGPLSPGALEAAAGDLLARHAVLRAAFHSRKSGEPVQLIRRHVEPQWTELDLRGLTQADQGVRLAEYQEHDRSAGFDMRRPPLIRFALLRLAQERSVLVLTYHHILLDAWSFQIVLDDLCALYAARADGDRAAELPAVVPFQRYLGWISAQDRPAAEQAWSAALAGLEEPTRIARGRGAATASMPRLCATELSEIETAELTRTARAAGLTLNTVIQGAWALLLSGLTGSSDVVFGQVVSGRPAHLDGVEDLVGLLIGAAPVRVRLDPAEPLVDLLLRLQQEQADLEPHHFLGLADIQRLVGLGELYDTSVAFGSAPADWDDTGAMTVGGLRIGILAEGGESPEEERTGSTHYPLNLTAVPGRMLRLALSYRRDLLDRDAVERLLARLRDLLEILVRTPRLPVGRIRLLAHEEITQILRDWNDTWHAVPQRTLPGLLATQAARTPDATAVVFGDQTLTYAEFTARVDRLAAVLRSSGVRTGDFVAVALPRSLELVVALHATVSAGAAYVPIDPDYPPERISAILADARPALLLGSASTVAALDAGVIPVLLVDQDLAAGGPTAPVAADRELAGADPAYVIFTSGSTGRPKGVVVSHASIVNRLLWMQDRYALGADDRVLQKTPSGFDVSVWEFFWPLQAGATLVVAAPDGHKDPAYLAGLIQRERVTCAHFVPSMLAAFLREPAAAGCASLRQVFSSGEALPAETQNRFFSLLDAGLHNLYGPTEAAVDVTYWECRRDTGATTVPIGRPVWNTRVYVLDEMLRPAAIGVPGELYLAGRQLATGYAARPGLTGERFVADPYGGPGSRMYRTGDIAAWTPDGALEYLGRTDDQVKLRGQRVELGEIEAVLARHPSVAQAAVVVREDQPGVRRLVGYVTSAGPDLDPGQLLAHVTAALPEYMVPSAVIGVPRLPLTPNGKLDRKALPAPARLPAGRRPRGDVQEKLASLFAAVLGLPEVGADDSFFELGGDSIVSIQLVARARQAGLVFTPKDVFTQRTVAALAGVVRPAATAAAEAPAAGVGPLPATPIMRWLGERPGPTEGFSQSAVLRVPAGLGRERLAAAVQALIDRHDALRMRRVSGGQTPGLDVAAPGTVPASGCVRQVNVAGVDAAGLRARVEAAAAQARAELSPDDRRLIRVVWFDAGPATSGRLLIMIHHLAVDEVSWRILVPDLQSAWEAVARGDQPRLEPAATSLRTWSGRLAAAATEPAREAELGFWVGQSSAASDPALTARPLDPARDVFGTARSLTVALGPEQVRPLLGRVPAAYHASIEDVLLTALALAIGGWRRNHGRGDGTSVLVDVEGHGREQIADDLDLSRTVGWFTSLYPVRIDPGAGDWQQPADPARPGLGRALKRVKEQLRVLADHGIGYGMLRYLNPRTGPLLAGLPDAHIGFNYLGRVSGASDGDWQAAPENDATGLAADAGLSMPHPLELVAATEDQPGGPQLHAVWTWPDALFTEQEVRELADLWFCALRALIAHAARPGSGGLTPSDVVPAEVSQGELECLEASCAGMGGLADVLPLTPLQEGLLFHARYDREAVDVYTVQAVLDLTGPLEPARMRLACQALTDRHDALRAAFVPSSSGTHVQVVPRRVPVPWRELDLPGDDRFQAFLTADRSRRFDPAVAPLLRFSLVRLAAQRHALVFTSHHLLTDGWSLSLVLQDLLELYAANGGQDDRPAPPAPRRYYDWLARQDAGAAETAWRAVLDGLPGPTLVAPGADAGSARAMPERMATELPAGLTARLVSRAGVSGLTLNAVVQGAWALVLAELTGRADVVFGATVSVRPPELPGVEEMVGLQINTVPVRARLEPGETLDAFFGRLQAQQADLARHAFLAPVAIQRLAGFAPLYDTSMVFENHPGTQERPAPPGTGLRLAGISGRDAYHYPLKLMAAPGDRLLLEVSHRAELVPAGRARHVLRRLEELLTAYARDPLTLVDGPVGGPGGGSADGPGGGSADGTARGSREPAVTAPASPAPPETSAYADVLGVVAAEVLGLPSLNADADFFAHGGDSISALRLAGRIREVFGEAPDVAIIFRHRTVARIAGALTVRGRGDLARPQRQY